MIANYYPLDPRVYVRDELQIRQKCRPQYSMRAFARDLEISPSFLCEFLAGRQGLSRARAIWIAEKIRLSSEQSDHFWDLIQAHYANPESSRQAALFRVKDRAKTAKSHLNLEHFNVVADWYCFVLLEILGLENAPRSVHEISILLNVPVKDLELAIQRLIALGFLSRENAETGVKYKVLTESTSVGEEVDDRAIQVSHQQSLRMHAEAIDRKPFAERENLTCSFAASQSEWSVMRKEIQKAILDVISRFGNTSKEKDQVISFTMQMITLLESSSETEPAHD